MKKKLVVLLLVALTALAAVSAKDAPFRLGGQLGWGFDNLYGVSTGKSGDEEKAKMTTKYANNGIAFNVLGEYELSDKFALRANIGMMYAGKAKYSYSDKYNKDTNYSSTYSNKSGLYFDAILGLRYTYDFSKTWSLSGIGGVELLTGKVYKTGKEDTDKNTNNLAFGINIAFEAQYKINKNIYLTGGVSASWFMINNTKVIESAESTYGKYSYSRKINSFYFRPYAGMIYAF